MHVARGRWGLVVVGSNLSTSESLQHNEYECYRRRIGEQPHGPRVSITPIVIAIILTFTAIPFELRFPTWSAIEFGWDRGDLIRNVIFFLPLGMFSNRGLLATAILGAVVSTCAEVCQMFSATRHPALADIATNITVAIAGWLLARRMPQTIPLSLVVCTVSIASGLVLAVALIPQTVPTDLSNWDSKFLMKVGTESGGQSDCRGEVRGVTITSGAMSADEIAKFADRGPGDLPRTLPKAITNSSGR